MNQIKEKLTQFFSLMRRLNRKGKTALVVLLGMIVLLVGACQMMGQGNETAEGEQSVSKEAGIGDTAPGEEEDTVIDIRVAAVGDVMGHTTQLESAYDGQTDTYDFRPHFADVKPFIEDADLAIANLETTLRGTDLPYGGYPLFNTPDEIVDALADTGFDTIVTANNHSLDTREEGLRRTAQVIEDKGLTAVGTYAEEPESRVWIEDVEGIKLAILSYTEALNGLEAQYTQEQLDSMLNVMDQEQIKTDIEEAKAHEPDLILAYMHWGEEYAPVPSQVQISYAEMMAEEGVDVIIGGHPHVIQRTEWIETEAGETFVAYSLGNFISNQRRESLGESFTPTEDGVILNLDIQKDIETSKTTVENIELVPTWVYRSAGEGAAFDYRVLPIEASLDDPSLPEDIIQRMRNSYEETMSRMSPEDSEEEPAEEPADAA